MYSRSNTISSFVHDRIIIFKPSINEQREGLSYRGESLSPSSLPLAALCHDFTCFHFLLLLLPVTALRRTRARWPLSGEGET